MAKILVIDDFGEARAIVREMLEMGGHDVIEACNGKEGLEMIEDHEPDVITTDILMPEMDGLEMISRVAKSHPTIPIIAFTASTTTPFLEIALKMGATTGLYKPFEPDELLYAIQTALQKP